MNRGLLVITELYLPTKGGTAVWFDEVYRRLGGKEIHVVTADVPGADVHDRNHPNTIHRLKLRRVGWLKPESLGMYAKIFVRSLQVMWSQPIDGIHAGRVLPEGLVGLMLARIFRKPLVVYAHGEEITTWRQPVKFRVMKATYRHADKVIANSEFTRDELLKLGVNPARIVLIYPGVDTDRFRPGLPCQDLKRAIGLGPSQKLLLSVGRLSRRKGFDMVIQALPKVLNSGVDAHYALIGIGEDWEFLHRLANECEVADRVHFLGHVPAEDLPRWYNACDIFVMPNREINGDTEGFGMVFIEAAACGKPSIAGKAGGTGAAVVDGETGVRIDGGNLEDLSRSIVALLKDVRLPQAMGASALRRAANHFGWERIAERTQEVASLKQ